jgi:hypothetical protein
MLMTDVDAELNIGRFDRTLATIQKDPRRNGWYGRL